MPLSKDFKFWFVLGFGVLSFIMILNHHTWASFSLLIVMIIIEYYTPEYWK